MSRGNSILQLKNIFTTTSNFIQQVYGDDTNSGTDSKLQLLHNILKNETQCKKIHKIRHIQRIGDEAYITLDRVDSFPEKSFVFEDILTKGSFNAKVYEPLFTIMWLLAKLKNPVAFLQTTKQVQPTFRIYIKKNQTTPYGPEAIINFWRTCAKENEKIINNQIVHIGPGNMFTKFLPNFQKMCMKFLSMFEVEYTDGSGSAGRRHIFNPSKDENLFLKGIQPLKKRRHVMRLLNSFAQATGHTELDALRLIYDVSNMFGFGCLVFSQWFEKPVKINTTARRFFCLRFHEIDQNEFVNDGSTTWAGILRNTKKESLRDIQEWFVKKFGSRELRLVVALPTQSPIKIGGASSSGPFASKLINKKSSATSTPSTPVSRASSTPSTPVSRASSTPSTPVSRASTSTGAPLRRPTETISSSDISENLRITKDKLEKAETQINEIQAQNEELNTRITTLKTLLENEQTTKQEHQDTLEHTNTKLQNCQDEKRTLLETKEQCEHDKATLTLQNQKLQQDNQKCVDENTKCQNEKEIINQSLQDAKSKLTKLDTITRQNTQMVKEMAQLHSKHEEANTTIETLRNKNAEQHKRINVLYTQINTIQAQMKDLRQDVSGSSKTTKNNVELRQKVEDLNTQISTLETQLTQQNDALKFRENELKEFYMTYTCSELRFTKIEQVNATIKILTNQFEKNLLNTPSQLDLGILTRICCTAIHAKNFSIDVIRLPDVIFNYETQAMIGMDWVMGLRGLALSNDYGALICNFAHLSLYIQKVIENGNGFCGTHPGMHMFDQIAQSNEPIRNILESVTKANTQPEIKIKQKTLKIWQDLVPKLSDIQLQILVFEYLPAIPNLTKNMLKMPQFHPIQKSFSNVVFWCMDKNTGCCVVDDIGKFIWIYATKTQRVNTAIEKIINPKLSPEQKEYDHVQFDIECNDEHLLCFHRTPNTQTPLGYTIKKL
jgi:predicted  nucleic acid-binding Zn-ribbon protein